MAILKAFFTKIPCQRCSTSVLSSQTRLASTSPPEVPKFDWGDNPQSTSRFPPVLRPQNVTSFFADMISNAKMSHLSEVVQHRSKRMILDTLGVGIVGFRSEITTNMMLWAQTMGYLEMPCSSNAVIWGSSNKQASIGLAAFLNGISVHSMDFDDTWHPATHPSGPVLPAILALSEFMTGSYRPTSEELLVAYNVGVQTQGLLLQCSTKSKSIPDRFHPPAVVGVMGSAAASARLLNLGTHKTRHALAIAASFAGAPMANAGTKTKPLHAGKSARFGLESALMAEQGMEGNENILDVISGFGAFFDDYSPLKILEPDVNNQQYILHTQDLAIKRFPAHLGMHWAVDATVDIYQQMTLDTDTQFHYNQVELIEILAPPSKYIDRPLPTTQHEARHSFQFNVASALLDGTVTPESFSSSWRSRPSLQAVLQKCHLRTKEDNVANFNSMYVEVTVVLSGGQVYKARCDTPYGHWRRPLTDSDVQRKFLTNTKSLPAGVSENIIRAVYDSSGSSDELIALLKY